MSKLLDVTTKQVIRGQILRLCKACVGTKPYGIAMEVMTAMLRKEGYDVTKENVAEECGYLAGKGFIKVVEIKNEALGISRDIAHIEPDGIDLLEGTAQAGGIILGD